MAWNNSSKLPRRGILAGFLCLPSLLAQGSGYLTVGQPEKAAGKRHASIQVKIPVSVRTGYHVNSNMPREEYLIPLKLTWTSPGALEPEAVLYPAPSIEKYAFADQPLSVFSGNFDLVAHFKVKGDAPAGPGVTTGKLRYQACSDRACYAPRTVDVTVLYQIQ